MTTITRCFSLDQAQLLKTRLMANGIAAFIPDEFMAQSEPVLSGMSGLRIQVPEEQVEDARRVLADPGEAL